MKRVSFFIDGFNFYHSLKNKRKFHRYLWLDYSELAKHFLVPGDEIKDIFYFTAIAKWRGAATINRHKDYIKALEFKGIKPVLGEFKKKDKYCKICKRESTGYEEKQSDVNLSIYLLTEAVKGNYDKAVIITADSDFIPAVKAVKDLFPQKMVGVVFPIGLHSNQLRDVCDFSRSIHKLTLKNSQLDDHIIISPTKTINRPASYV